MRTVLLLSLAACSVADPVYNNANDPYRPRIFDKGDRGDKGDIGPMGPMGPQGFDGVDGLKGEKGDVGPAGPQGLQGERGPVGLQGLTGPQGLQGLKGDAGIAGIQGLKGDRGDVGPQGPAGKCQMFFGDSNIYRTSVTIKPTETPSPAPNCNLFYKDSSNWYYDSSKIIDGWKVGGTLGRSSFPSMPVCTFSNGAGSYNYFYLTKTIVTEYFVDIPNIGQDNIDDVYMLYFYRLGKTKFSSYFSFPYIESSIEYVDGDIKIIVEDVWVSGQTKSKISETNLDIKVVVIE